MQSKVLVYLTATEVEKLLELATERIVQSDYELENLKDKIDELRDQLAEARENQKEEEE